MNQTQNTRPHLLMLGLKTFPAHRFWRAHSEDVWAIAAARVSGSTAWGLSGNTRRGSTVRSALNQNTTKAFVLPHGATGTLCVRDEMGLVPVIQPDAVAVQGWGEHGVGTDRRLKWRRGHH